MKYENDYIALLNEGLYEETFLLLEKNVNLVENKIEQKKQIREFCSIINEEFDNLLEAGTLTTFSNELVHAFRDMPFLEETSKKFSVVFDNEKIALMFSLLLINSDFNNAKFLLPFFNRNIEIFTNTLEQIFDNKNSDAIRFICENMDNIHYGNGELLRKSVNLPVNTLISLLDNFNFDINEADSRGSNLVSLLITNKNLRSFKAIVDKFSDKINWGYSFMSGNKNSNLFNLINETKTPLDFYSTMLNRADLKQSYVEKIAQALFADENIIKTASDTDIYSKLFNHAGFDHQAFNLEQGYFLYGLLGKIGLSSSDNSKEELTKSYVKILDAFLDSRTDDEMPMATTMHIVGAAVFVANESPSKSTIDACTLILRRYRNYINKPNPDGKLPISQVEEGSPLFRLLVNNGAISPGPEPTFWNSIFGGKRKAEREALLKAQQEEQFTQTKKSAPSSFTSLSALKVQMRQDFREMRQTLSSDLCEPTIKMKCENMFLNADNLVTKMEEYKITNANEDMFFLSQNFSNYLSKSLDRYINLCKATVDFSSQNDMASKLLSAKNNCLEQITLLDEQVKLITTNIYSEVEKGALKGMKVQHRFLEERLESSNTKDFSKNIDELVQTASIPALPSQSKINKLSVENLEPLEDGVVNILGNHEESKPQTVRKMKI